MSRAQTVPHKLISASPLHCPIVLLTDYLMLHNVFSYFGYSPFSQGLLNVTKTAWDEPQLVVTLWFLYRLNKPGITC